MYQVRLEQLVSYAADLRNLEGANIVETAQLILGKLRAEQSHSFEETKKVIAARAIVLTKIVLAIRAFLKFFKSQSLIQRAPKW